ncbi:hypothetical protein SAMD00019534_031750, partial [Acytostelium subglobosum LB1]|uniref:hypothetical protein n=1 Tax=Acytostelium subglobosum LB1 TaxID=1410327 RepID=UPI0006451AB6
RRVAILGGGVSGLSTHHYLTKNVSRLNKTRTSSPDDQQQLHIDVFESQSQLGGWMQTKHINDSTVVEIGPRSIRVAGHGRSTLDLVSELRLDNQVIFASKKAKTRHMMIDGIVVQLPSSFLGALAFAYKHSLFQPVLSEPSKPKGQGQEGDDESIQSFFTRRLGATIANRFIEPVCLGIYGGDVSRMSIRSCFPTMYEYEHEYGSLIRGALFHKKATQTEDLALSLDHDSIRRVKSILNKDTDESGIFSFKNGLSTLTDALGKAVPQQHLHLGKSIMSVHANGNKGSFTVVDNTGASHECDSVISTLPLGQLTTIVGEMDSTLARLCAQQEYSSIAVINLVYDSPIVRSKVAGLGFGYLVASCESQPVLGVAIDSNTFPTFVNDQSKCIITVMIGGNKDVDKINDHDHNGQSKLVNIAIDHINKYILSTSSTSSTSTTISPVESMVRVCHDAIPHYIIGHQQLIKDITTHLEKKYNGTFIIGGNSMYGVGLNDAIFNSKRIANRLVNTIYN